jgi:hypothetical protein
MERESRCFQIGERSCETWGGRILGAARRLGAEGGEAWVEVRRTGAPSENGVVGLGARGFSALAGGSTPRPRGRQSRRDERAGAQCGGGAVWVGYKPRRWRGLIVR